MVRNLGSTPTAKEGGDDHLFGAPVPFSFGRVLPFGERACPVFGTKMKVFHLQRRKKNSCCNAAHELDQRAEGVSCRGARSPWFSSENAGERYAEGRVGRPGGFVRSMGTRLSP